MAIVASFVAGMAFGMAVLFVLSLAVAAGESDRRLEEINRERLNDD